MTAEQKTVIIPVEAPDTTWTRYAKEQLRALEVEYRQKAESYVKILTDHALMNPPKYFQIVPVLDDK
jgi:hypothetical protein